MLLLPTLGLYSTSTQCIVSALAKINDYGEPQKHNLKSAFMSLRNFGQGILVNNVVVAVKQLFQETNKGRDDFVNEVLLIANLQHRNLVTLKGYCLHGKQTLLVYEYVDNCDLHKLLLSKPQFSRISH